jgi:hypothetical protein
MCVNVSGTDGTYKNESDCLNSDCEKTTSTINCSSASGILGYFSHDDCYNNNKLVDSSKWLDLSSESCTDGICKGCQSTCNLWYQKFGPWLIIVLSIIVLIVIIFAISS